MKSSLGVSWKENGVCLQDMTLFEQEFDGILCNKMSINCIGVWCLPLSLLYYHVVFILLFHVNVFHHILSFFLINLGQYLFNKIITMKKVNSSTSQLPRSGTMLLGYEMDQSQPNLQLGLTFALWISRAQSRWGYPKNVETYGDYRPDKNEF